MVKQIRTDATSYNAIQSHSKSSLLDINIIQLITIYDILCDVRLGIHRPEGTVINDKHFNFISIIHLYLYHNMNVNRIV